MSLKIIVYKFMRIKMLFVFCVLSYFSLTQTQNKIPRLYKKVLPAVLKISVIHNDGTSGAGTGFFIDQSTIVTCFHITRAINNITIESPTGQKFTADSVLSSNKLGDLIVFTVKEKSKHWLKLDKNIPKIAVNVYLIGNPDGYDYSVSSGIVAGIRSKNGFKLIQHTAPCSSGNSGGPMLNHKGKVIGVASFVKFGAQNLNFAVSATEIINLKDDNTIQKLIPAFKKISQVEIDSLYSLAKTYLLQKDYNTALNTVLPIINFVTDTTTSLELTQMIGDCHFFSLDYSKATPYYELLIKSLYSLKKKNPSNVLMLCETMYKIALCHFALNDLNGTLVILSKAKEICSTGIQNDQERKEVYTKLIQQIYATEAICKFSLDKLTEACMSWQIAKQYGLEGNEYGLEDLCK